MTLKFLNIDSVAAAAPEVKKEFLPVTNKIFLESSSSRIFFNFVIEPKPEIIL